MAAQALLPAAVSCDALREVYRGCRLFRKSLDSADAGAAKPSVVTAAAERMPSALSGLVHLEAGAVVAWCGTRIAPIQRANGTDSVVYN